MEDLNNRLARLLDKSEWTDDDKQWLMEYLEQDDSPELRSLMYNEFSKRNGRLQNLPNDVSATILDAIHSKIGVKKQLSKAPVLSLWYKSAVAVAIIGICFTIISLVSDNNRLKNTQAFQVQNGVTKRLSDDDIAPGGNKALLTLANGSTIVLDDAKDGTLALQGKTRVLKIEGRLTYTGAQTGNDEVSYNTITTPRGGEYQVMLPDGSQVWLNAASSLRFPTHFNGSERSVVVTGEAYFEVAKNPAMPFVVHVNNAAIKVFGTHFNVMAYVDEDLLKTTLLEGSVQFASGDNCTMLKPGQQSQLVSNGTVKVLNGVNVEEVVAWKNGVFHFEKIDEKTMMRQIARWYDVEVVYQDERPAEKFYADIPRNTSLHDILRALELTGKIQFTIEGKKVIVR